MGRKVKVLPEIKIRIVEDYLKGKFSISGSYPRANVSSEHKLPVYVTTPWVIPEKDKKD